MGMETYAWEIENGNGDAIGFIKGRSYTDAYRKFAELQARGDIPARAELAASPLTKKEKQILGVK